MLASGFARHAMVALAALIACTSLAPLARAADAAGCQDLGGLKRFEGSSIVLCEKRNFAEYTLLTGKAVKDEDGRPTDKFEASLKLEGRLAQNVYAVPMGTSPAEVFRNYKADLEARGYKILFEAKQAETLRVGDFLATSPGPGTQLWDDYNADDARYAAALKEEGGVKTYIALYINEYQAGYEPKLQAGPEKNQVMVRLDTLQLGQLTDRMVVVSAAEIGKALDSSGKVALYGILFDFNKAVIKPESRPSLDEIGKFLKDNPGQSVYVIGHTDNVGGFDFNMQLSKARAAAVVADLAHTYGIPSARMAASGVGLQAPVASNANEDGRAKNRRVELIPR
jgi:outer membrane protein OmpA-like peptidoglycan-associated protein